MRVTAYRNRPYYPSPRKREPDFLAPPLGTAVGASLGVLAGQQGAAAWAFFGGATGMLGGFAAGYLAGSTIAREFGGNSTARYLSGLAVGAGGRGPLHLGGLLQLPSTVLSDRQQRAGA